MAPAPSPAASEQATGFSAAAAMGLVSEIAAIGPREATTSRFREAGALVRSRLEGLGYVVEQQRFRVPAGESWGVPVGGGRTYNLVATLRGHTPGDAHLIVGAHLDTVPQSPGAEDNASGVAVLVELARLAVTTPTRLPVTFVVFGAEEPRGPGDDEHHFGSQTYVRRFAGEAGSITAMVALDRVGTGSEVPVCTGGLSPPREQRRILAAAERLDVAARRCENRTSDHWPFEKAGHVVARVGGNDYAEYHSARDRGGVVDRRQIARVGTVLWEWMRG